MSTYAMSSANRGDASVIGNLLLVGIVIVLAFTSTVTYLAFADQLDIGGPIFASQSTVDIDIDDTGGITSQELRVVHSGGQAVSVERLELLLKSDRRQVTKTVEAEGDLADGQWTAGETLTVPLETEEVCSGGDHLDLRLQSRTSAGKTYVVGTERIPIERDGFIIQDGQVVPTANYTATVELLGTGLTYGTNGPRIDVEVDVVIDGTTYEPWPGNVNDGGGARSHQFTDQPSGAGISVAVTGDPDGDYISPRTRTSTGGGNWVYTLRDGDTPPDIEGFGNQGDVASYVAPYVDSDGTISLSSNEAIFLVELGNSQSGSAADYQDAVVLVTLQTEATETGIRQVQDNEYVVICPESTDG